MYVISLMKNIAINEIFNKSDITTPISNKIYYRLFHVRWLDEEIIRLTLFFILYVFTFFI